MTYVRHRVNVMLLFCGCMHSSVLSQSESGNFSNVVITSLPVKQYVVYSSLPVYTLNPLLQVQKTVAYFGNCLCKT